MIDPAACLVGVFLGGRARRMAGEPKGLLPVPSGDETIVARLLRLCADQGLPCAAVGPIRAYEEAVQGLTQLTDRPPGIGPLGGLGALIAHAGAAPSIALACDMPHVTAELLARLAAHPSAADVVAPRDPKSGRWQPLFARYASPRVAGPLQDALQAGERSFQALFARLSVEELQLNDAERAALVDWDAPEDIDSGPA